jgi:hypothetical protein
MDISFSYCFADQLRLDDNSQQTSLLEKSLLASKYFFYIAFNHQISVPRQISVVSIKRQKPI